VTSECAGLALSVFPDERAGCGESSFWSASSVTVGGQARLEIALGEIRSGCGR